MQCDLLRAKQLHVAPVRPPEGELDTPPSGDELVRTELGDQAIAAADRPPATGTDLTLSREHILAEDQLLLRLSISQVKTESLVLKDERSYRVEKCVRVAQHRALAISCRVNAKRRDPDCPVGADRDERIGGALLVPSHLGDEHPPGSGAVAVADVGEAAEVDVGNDEVQRWGEHPPQPCDVGKWAAAGVLAGPLPAGKR